MTHVRHGWWLSAAVSAAALLLGGGGVRAAAAQDAIVRGRVTSDRGVPFAVSRIDPSQMPVPAANALTQIQVKEPGANIVSSSGRPGAQPSVLLRGVTSLNGQGRGQDPLYIVDGAIVNGGLPDINAEDIDNVEVVKGAAAASLYGSRAANGVINITTKSARRALEGATFHFRNEAGTNDIERDFGIAQRTALLMDERNQQFCMFLSGQPTCARTFNYAYEAYRINNYPGDSALGAPVFPVDPGATISGNVLRQRFQNTPWPGQSYDIRRTGNVQFRDKGYRTTSFD